MAKYLQTGLPPEALRSPWCGQQNRARHFWAGLVLADGTPLPVLVSQIHRRLRDLVLVREHLDAGSKPPRMVKELKLQPFRARKLSEQARDWTLPALEAALVDLLALDLRSKGIALDGSTLQMSEGIDALTVQTWIARHAAAVLRARPR